MLGSWSAAGVAAQTVTLRQGLEAAVGKGGQIIHTRGANVTDDAGMIKYLNFLNWDRPEVSLDPRTPQAMIDEAVRAAREADVIVAAVGEARGMSHESSSRTSLALPASQQALLEALVATGKPLVVVLMNGRPLQLGWVKEHADAVLETWFAGTEGGHAIADVLFGAHNPSGKLPISFPRSVGQIPTYYNHPRLGRPYVEGRPGNYTSQYFEEPNGALYPFGYGLSYTDFELSKPQLSRRTLNRGQKLEVSVTVKNTGARAGATVVQLYLQDLVGSSVRPVKELKGFRKLMLEPGETQPVRFVLGEEDLKFYDARLDHVAEPGEFEVQLGLDSQSVLSERFELL
jgi:beta-glucosidase